MGSRIAGFQSTFANEDVCLEWLKNQIFPQGINCPVCNKTTKHHKISKRHCYACDVCRHQVYPASGTIFHKSSVPLKTWFEVIWKVSNSNGAVSVNDIRKGYGVSYKTACRMLEKIKDTFKENQSINNSKFNISDICTHFDNNHPNRNKFEIQQKKDRTARLLKLQILLWQHPQGLTIEELADRCSISKRTAYRDLKALESELEVPIWEEQDKRGIVEGYYLPPISFTLAEANNIFFAARLMQQFSPAFDSNIISTLMKLNTIVSLPLRKQIRKTLDYMERQPRDSRVLNNLNKLIQGWLTQHKVRITYQNLVDEEEPVERVIEPYFIEPSIYGGSSYLLGFCHLKKIICAFAISYIIGNVTIEPETFEIPDNFNAIDYLSAAWGIYSEKQEIETVKLHFKSNISKSILDIKLHSSQKTEVQKDGSVIMTIKVRDTIQFFGWILAWRDKVEVLEPVSMRNEICELARLLLDKYHTHEYQDYKSQA
jgi:predicted DNA-binding transcriptional regulator YafY/transposase-like protein